MDLTRSESHGWRKQREKQHYGVAVISMQPWPGLISNQYADLFAGVGVVCRLFLALLQRQGRKGAECLQINSMCFSFNVCFIVYYSHTKLVTDTAAMMV